MTSIRTKTLILLAATALLLPSLGWACGASSVCGDATSSFYGEVILEGVRLTWNTDAENSAITSYRLKRYNCSDPSTCSVTVATINHTGTCGVNESYDYTDHPPSPVSSWIYTLEVRRADGTRACAIDVTPQ